MINPFFDITGKTSTVLALVLNLGNWLFTGRFNIALTIVLSILSILYLVMKIYDQYLITKRRKQIHSEEDEDTDKV